MIHRRFTPGRRKPARSAQVPAAIAQKESAVRPMIPVLVTGYSGAEAPGCSARLRHISGCDGAYTRALIAAKRNSRRTARCASASPG